MNTPTTPPRGASLLGLLAVAVIALLSVLANRPPPVVGRDGPADAFSAERALDLLVELAPKELPRPVGSAEARRFRAGLISQLKGAGLSVNVQKVAVCGDGGTSCAPVENIVARWTPEGADGPPVVLASHSDSVPAGPGAGDASSSAAALVEIVRALQAGTPPKRPVVVLITDGEEAGLLGAQAVVDAGLLPEVAAVVNLEARGTTGRSWMFEVSDSGGWLIDRYVTEVPHPATTSLAAAVYRAMPNGTDLTVFRQAGWPGVGLAFIGGGGRYHTPRDDRAHLDLGSVQHSGETALALARAVGSGERLPGERVYFDVLGRQTVAWPLDLMLPLSGGTVALLVVAWAVRRQEGVLRAAAGTALALVAGTALGAGGWWLLDQLGLLAGSASAALPWGAGACAAWGVVGALAVGGAIMGPVGPAARAAGVGLAWAAGGLALCFVEPGAAYLLTLPAAATALGALLPQSRVLLALPIAVATVLMMPLPLVLPDALGPPALVVIGLTSALNATWLLPAVRGSGVVTAIAATLVGIGLAIGTGQVAPFTVDNPVGANVEHVQDDRGARMQVVGNPVPTGMTGGMAEAGLAPPRVERLGRDAKGRHLLRLIPARRAQRLQLALAQGSTLAEVRYPGLAGAPGKGGTTTNLWAVSSEGVVVAIEGEGAYLLTEIDPCLPDRTAEIEQRRPEHSVQVQWGNVTRVSVTGTI